jgi:hypothetical protein
MEMRREVTMNNALQKTAVGLFFAGMIGFVTIPAAAQQVSLSTTIKNKTFQPSVLKAPANRPIVITIHNADGAAAEFESRTLRVEKVVPAGGTIVVNRLCPEAIVSSTTSINRLRAR